MILQGCVRGAIYPVTQQAYEEPIDATRRCGHCGRRFVYDPETRLRAFCSMECKHQAHLAQARASRRRVK